MMVESTATIELALPSLLERITNRRGDGSADRRISGRQRYRESVLADMEALLNTSNRASTMDWDHYPEIRESVLNFGITPISGLTGSQIEDGELERSIARSIRCFEPRIDRKTLDVRQIKSMHNTLSIEIRGQLRGLQWPEEVCIKTRIDLECGRCDMQERNRG